MISVSKVRKKEIIDITKELILKSKGFYVIDYKGWNVAQVNELRKKLKEKSAYMKVIKNTLFQIALNELNIRLSNKLEGTNAFIFVLKDEVEPIKLISNFINETNKGALKLAYLNGLEYNKEQVELISKLPSIDELRAKVIGSISSPIYSLVYSLKGLINKLVVLLSQIKEKREE
ncbi:MAG: 50S ribosomal protein L10 [candidate division WOR-3 bacterium]|nr:50S ribosomal protein L10 [candidate division WOR-3 bacterium]MCX7947543.1 50S ribosomal protein L10 [candidate division WOR-3 bacterium]MDW8150429.1 50S ribosomal protein L10 [candidate division WOR-3 bacterium]